MQELVLVAERSLPVVVHRSAKHLWIVTGRLDEVEISASSASRRIAIQRWRKLAQRHASQR